VVHNQANDPPKDLCLILTSACGIEFMIVEKLSKKEKCLKHEAGKRRAASLK
jgi:hypothetical protein